MPPKASEKMPVKISAVVAMAENRCIGKDNALPWHIPEDFKRMKEITMGKPLVMGRKTYESIGRPLPGRTSIVISRSGFKAEGVISKPDMSSAIAKAKNIAERDGHDEIIIFGGGQIYKDALPQTDRVYLTLVHQNVDGDTFFPELQEEEWEETSSETHDDAPSYSFKIFERAPHV